MEDSIFVFGATLKSNKIGYSDSAYYNYVMHESSAVHQMTNKNLCMFKAFDSIKKLLNSMGLSKELKNEYDGYILRFISYHAGSITSKQKLKEVCRKKLSAE